MARRGGEAESSNTNNKRRVQVLRLAVAVRWDGLLAQTSQDGQQLEVELAGARECIQSRLEEVTVGLIQVLSPFGT